MWAVIAAALWVSCDGGASSPSPDSFPLVWRMDRDVRIPNEINGQIVNPLAPDVVVLPDRRFRMYYNVTATGIGSATSSDGMEWTPEPGLRVTSRRIEGQDDFDLGHPTVLRLSDNTWRLYCQSTTGIDTPPRWRSFASTDGLTFTPESGFPLSLGGGNDLSFAGHGRVWIGKDSLIHGLYSGNTSDDSGPSDIGTILLGPNNTFDVIDPHVFIDGHDPAAWKESDNSITVVYAYLQSAFYFSRSTDDGATWYSPVALTLVDPDGAPLKYADLGDVALFRRPDTSYLLMSNYFDGLRSFQPMAP